MSALLSIPLSATAKVRPKLLRQSEKGIQIYFERPQVAAVNANQIASSIESPPQLLFIMYFAQDIESMLARPPRQCREFLLLKRRRDQQHRIGAIRPRLEKLKFVNHEILAQAGKPRVCGSGPEVRQRSLEKLFICQH